MLPSVPHLPVSPLIFDGLLGLSTKIFGGLIEKSADGLSLNLNWFEAELDKVCESSKKDINRFQMQVCFPYIAYTGVIPDNKELILANIADKENPQCVFQLMHCIATTKEPPEFVCFVNNVNKKQETQILFLVQVNHNLDMYKLVKSQPFLKDNTSNGLSHFFIERDQYI